MSRRPTTDWWAEERAARERGFRVIAGIDEAGRGPLAGPVVAAAVILPFCEELRGVRDSKMMTPEQRETAFDLICEQAAAIGVGVVEPADIDAMNILRATHEAMRRAVANLPEPPEIALIDGRPVHPFPVFQKAIVKGDSLSASIAAASIIAKVTRDRLMTELDSAHPGYGFADHKGYCTADHLARLEELGPCAIHRRSFAPVARLLDGHWVTDNGRPQPGQPSLFDSIGISTGKSGEIIAAAHLKSLGLDILATGFRCYGGELDIVAADGETIVFVEVKAKRGRFGSPAEAVDLRKRRRILRAAEAWIAGNDADDRACRFDVVEVVFGRDANARVNLIHGAFMAGE